ncbi:MAG: peptidoglycan-associated lipoprotein Pal [Desulfovibrionaceae bacterium]|nr:peptidoglycan-associated lipoprotein Pal [Desulfovibrionaceae bacterium]MDD4951619.1 peptidoglycan-associated lipoprotein Pal [Desulfovibrionaceae bacterium]
MGRRFLFWVLLLTAWAAAAALAGCAKKETGGAPQAVVIEEQEVKVQAPPPAPEPAGPGEDELRQRRLAEERRALEQAAEALKEKIHFDFDRYELKPEARAVLEAKADILKRFPQITVLIEGHCDEWGTREYNMALGERRAWAAKEFLTISGVEAGRMSTVSYGEEEPLDKAHNRAAWALNRRDEFRPSF